MRDRNLSACAALSDRVLLSDYRHLVTCAGEHELWTNALQAALDEHEVVVIPPRAEPYYIHKPVIIGSDRRIEAHSATVLLTPDCRTLMLRNATAADGTHAPIPEGERDRNISISGGTWGESRTARAGYGQTGMYDEARSFYGVSTLFFFNNMDVLTLRDVTFTHTAGFALQAGALTDGLFEGIRFVSCFADGLHINGDTERILCRDIRGQVGDDLVALNAYDWQDSSVNFGPIRCALLEDMELSPDSPCKALRLIPAKYRFDDGSVVDCAMEDVIVSDVRGMWTVKVYLQTPRYVIGETPEWGNVGTANNLYFEHMTIDLGGPMDALDGYLHSDPVRGAFGAFEFCAQVGRVEFEDIDLTLHRDRFPLSYLAVVGPKSSIFGPFEIFDPYLSADVERFVLRDVCIRDSEGIAIPDTSEWFREVVFRDINRDGHSTGAGCIGGIEWAAY